MLKKAVIREKTEKSFFRALCFTHRKQFTLTSFFSSLWQPFCPFFWHASSHESKKSSGTAAKAKVECKTEVFNLFWLAALIFGYFSMRWHTKLKKWTYSYIYAERARIETPCDFKSMHSRVMTWQTHYSGIFNILAFMKIKEHHQSFSSWVLLF